jgi:hypothetical protein
MEDPERQPRVDRTAMAVVPLFEEEEEMKYWHARSPAERLRHMEMLRRINYGHLATARLQKVLELAPLEWRRVSGTEAKVAPART